MSSHDAIPLDPALPQLPVALNGAAMAEVFAGLVREHRPELSVEACTVDRIKYRPRRNVAVSYQLRLRDVHTGRGFEQLVATRFCTAGESALRHAKAQRRALAPSLAGPASSHVAALDMVAAWWPNDPKLGVAAGLLGADSQARHRQLSEALSALTGGAAELVSHQLQLAQVVPEHRACARVELSFRTGQAAPLQFRTLYVKADSEQRGATTHAVMQTLHRSAAQAEGRLLTPQPILWQGDCGLHWQAALPGTPLLDASPQVSAGASMRVGALLAGLHSVAVPTQRVVGVREWSARLGLVAQTLGLVEPRWEPGVRALAGSLAAGAHAFAAAPNVTLHGDLHPRNVLVDGDRPGLIDLDSVRRGPAIADLGDWIADAVYRALLGGQDVADALMSCRAFLRGYGLAALAPCAEDALAWSTANSLLCQRAWRSVVNLKPGRYALVEPLLEVATSILRSGSIDAALQTPHRLAA